MLSCTRRHNWCAIIDSGKKGTKYATESSYLVQDKEDVKEVEDDTTSSGYFATMNKHCGRTFLLTIFLYEHVMKGFVHQLHNLALPYLFKSYGVSAPKVLMFSIIINLPWAMKPIFNLFCDIFPIGGYSSMPYVLTTAICGTVCYAFLGFLPQYNLPVLLMVVLMCGAISHSTTIDSRFYISTVERIKKGVSEPKGNNLVANMNFWTEMVGLAGVFVSGFIIMSSGPKAVYIISFVFGMFTVYFVAMNCHEEKAVSPEATTTFRHRLCEQKEVCALTIMLLFLNLVLTVVVLAGSHVIAVGILSLCIVLAIFFCCVLALSPVIAAALVVCIIQTSVYFKVEAAGFYFNTDTIYEFPDGPHFSKFFFNSILGSVCCVAELLGLWTYLRYAPTWSYRNWLIMASFVASVGNVLYLLYYSRIISPPVPDWFFLIVTYSFHYIAEKWKFMPFVACFVYLTPKGMESTALPLFLGIMSLVDSCGSAFSAWFLDTLACRPAGLPNESEQFHNLWVVPLWNAIVPLVCILLFAALIPNGKPGMYLLADGDGFATDSKWQRLPTTRLGSWLVSWFGFDG